MAKCEHHDEFMRNSDNLKDYIDKAENNLDEKIKGTDKKLEIAFQKIDEVKEDLDNQGKDHRETSVYVKTLYGRFDELAQQMQRVITKLDKFITKMASVEQELNQNSTFNKRGKDLIYEIIKWLILIGLGYLIKTNT